MRTPTLAALAALLCLAPLRLDAAEAGDVSWTDRESSLLQEAGYSTEHAFIKEIIANQAKKATPKNGEKTELEWLKYALRYGAVQGAQEFLETRKYIRDFNADPGAEAPAHYTSKYLYVDEEKRVAEHTRQSFLDSLKKLWATA